ncbi:MAG: hypothetical protein K6T66_11625 [Peptococcaceae bacterium]|nr:hypothetical protein [Peptococcaceae bacterium]
MSGLLEREILAVAPGEAARILEEAGLQVELRRTGPPRCPEAGGQERVVRLQVRGNTALVTVVREMKSEK